MTKNFLNYCEENGYNKSELPSTNSLCCNWKYFDFISMIIGIQKFYKALAITLKDEKFKEKFEFDESKIKTCIEVYENDCTSLSFFVPLNDDKFILFKKSI